MEQLWGTAAPSKRQEPAEHQLRSSPKDEFNQLPASPAALLEFLASDEYRQAQQAQADKVGDSFKILDGCPWIAQRPLLTVAVPQHNREEAAAYTLPVLTEQVRSEIPGNPLPRPNVLLCSRAPSTQALTRYHGLQDDHSSELARLVGDPSLAGKLKHRHMQDGIIAFADTRAAMNFRDKLQAAGSLAAALTEVDSHALFREAADAKHVVVLVGPDSAGSTVAAISKGAHLQDSLGGPAEDVFVPSPAELAAALRGPSPMQDW